MKNSNNKTSIIIVLGIIILFIFSGVLVINILPNNESNPYYARMESKMNAKIEELIIEDSKLIIKTDYDAEAFCIKTTMSIPTTDALCWKKIEDNQATIPLYKNKKYYIWIKDSKNNISSYKPINN